MRVIAIDMIELGVGSGDTRIVARCFGVTERTFKTTQPLITIDHIVECAGAAATHFLGHVRCTQICRQTHIALIRAKFAKQQLEQRGLAGAVGARNTDVLAIMNGHAGIVEQQATATSHRHCI